LGSAGCFGQLAVENLFHESRGAGNVTYLADKLVAEQRKARSVGWLVEDCCSNKAIVDGVDFDFTYHSNLGACGASRNGQWSDLGFAERIQLWKRSRRIRPAAQVIVTRVLEFDQHSSTRHKEKPSASLESARAREGEIGLGSPRLP
jgi:hypothetical protein